MAAAEGVKRQQIRRAGVEEGAMQTCICIKRTDKGSSKEHNNNNDNQLEAAASDSSSQLPKNCRQMSCCAGVREGGDGVGSGRVVQRHCHGEYVS